MRRYTFFYWTVSRVEIVIFGDAEAVVFFIFFLLGHGFLGPGKNHLANRKTTHWKRVLQEPWLYKGTCQNGPHLKQSRHCGQNPLIKNQQSACQWSFFRNGQGRYPLCNWRSSFVQYKACILLGFYTAHHHGSGENRFPAVDIGQFRRNAGIQPDLA